MKEIKLQLKEAFIAGYDSESITSNNKDILAAYEAGKNASEENRVYGIRNPEFYLRDFLNSIKTN